jgi:hypothetical protein
MFEIYAHGPCLTGNETLAESDKKIVDSMVQDLDMVYGFGRLVDMSIDHICNQNRVTKTACEVIEKGVSIVSGLPKRVVTPLKIEEHIPSQISEVFKESFAKFLNTPALFKQKYGIPEERTIHALEGALILIPPIGYFRFSKLTPVLSLKKGTVQIIKSPLISPKKELLGQAKSLVKFAKKMGFEEFQQAETNLVKYKLQGAPSFSIPKNGNVNETILNSGWRALGVAAKRNPFQIIPANQNLGINKKGYPDFEISQNVNTSLIPILSLNVNVNEMEEAALKLLNIAGDLTGVTSLGDQAKDMENMFSLIFSDPENAPKLIVNYLLKEPENIFKKIISSPKEFVAHSETFLTDPTLKGALTILGTVYSIVSIANEVLPILTKIKEEAFKNPAKIPLVVTKEVLNLTKNKILGVFALAQGLLKHPGKTIENLVKGIIHSPKQLISYVKDFAGLGKSKKKKAKKKAEKLKKAVLEKAKLENERAVQELLKALPACYSTAREQWMIEESVRPEAYLISLVNDWKQAITAQLYKKSCLEFIQAVQKELSEGQFAKVIKLSPKAHANQLMPPKIIVHAMKLLDSEIVKFSNSIQNLSLNINGLESIVSDQSVQIAKLAETNKKFSALVQDKSAEELAEKLKAGLADQKKREAARKLLNLT